MKRHPVEILSLTSGIVFLIFAMTYLIGSALSVTPMAAITLPLLLVGLGAAGISAAFVAQYRAP